MANLDYVVLPDTLAPPAAPSWPLRNTIAGAALLALAALSHWAVSRASLFSHLPTHLYIHLPSHLSSHLHLPAHLFSTPRDAAPGLDSVEFQPGVPGYVVALPPKLLDRESDGVYMFIYGTLAEDSKVCKWCWEAARSSRLQGSARSYGLVYGAKASHAALAEITGQPGDVLAGALFHMTRAKLTTLCQQLDHSLGVSTLNNIHRREVVAYRAQGGLGALVHTYGYFLDSASKPSNHNRSASPAEQRHHVVASMYNYRNLTIWREVDGARTASKDVIHSTTWTNMQHTSALCVIPPVELWPPIQSIRRAHDKAFARWMPHVNLIYPFLPEADFPQAVDRLRSALATAQDFPGSFQCQLATFGKFRQRFGDTVHLKPKCEPESSMIRLQELCQSALFPTQNSDKKRTREKPFVPHLTVAQFPRNTSEQDIKRLQDGWNSLKFSVTHVHLISRGKDTPFSIVHSIPLDVGKKTSSPVTAAAQSPAASTSVADKGQQGWERVTVKITLAGKQHDQALRQTSSLDDVDGALLHALNPAQRAAVTWPIDRHALVLAGAGTGKTRVITTRVAYLLQRGVAQPSQICVLTFTNKAAMELQERLSTMLHGRSIDDMWVGTFHGLSYQMLKQHGHLVKLDRNFTILDQKDQQELLKRLLKQAGYEVDMAATLLAFISRNKEAGLRAKAMPTTPDLQVFTELYSLYEKECEQQSVVDFDELLLRCYEMLADHAQLRTTYAELFKYMFVDEFQDTNCLQYKWLRLLAQSARANTTPKPVVQPAHAEHKDNEAGYQSTLTAYRRAVQKTDSMVVMAVGDDDQSIYAFRGAQVKNMADFVQDFKVQPIKLELNYRSSSNILDAANHVITSNQERLGKTLRSQGERGETVVLVRAPDEQQEAEWVVRQVKQALGAAVGSVNQTIAVLYRCNFQSQAVELGLTDAGVPYSVTGGLRFLDRNEIRDALAYLRLLVNPHDDIAFLRVVNTPRRGIGAKSLDNLQTLATTNGTSLAGAVPAISEKDGAKIKEFSFLLELIRRECSGKDLANVMGLVLDRSGLLDYYRDLDKKEGNNENKNATGRVDNLQQLITSADHFWREHNGNQLDGHRKITWQVVGSETTDLISAFLKYVTLDPHLATALLSKDTVQNKVELMTIHSAKGLEFDRVFLIGLEEGLLPLSPSQDKRLMEEERRLFYVAITRARYSLAISFAASRKQFGYSVETQPSRFLRDLPPGRIQLRTIIANKYD